MPPTADDFADAEARSRDSFNDARATLANARKTITWLIAALGIVWLSGLEGGLQSVLKQARAFHQINSLRQEAEKKTDQLYTELTNDQTALSRLAKFKKPQLEADVREAQSEIDKARLKKESKAETSWQDKLQERLRRLQDLNELPQLKARVQELERGRAKWKDDALKEYHKAKEASEALGRDVNFELFGLKLKTPLLFTPVLWSLGLLSLLYYLISVRQRVIALVSDGFRNLAEGSHQPASSVAIVGPLPAWTAREVLQNYVSNTTNEPSGTENQLWVRQVFGSQQSRRISNILSALIPLIAFLLQLRVAWIGIEFTRYLGTNQTRALNSFALILGLFALCWLAREWFVFTPSAPAETKPAKHRGRRVLGVLAAVGLAVVLILIWFEPFIGIKAGHFVQKQWGPLCLLASAIIVIQAWRHFLPPPAPNQLLGKSPVTRRRAIIIASVALLLGAGIFRIGQRRRNPRFRNKRKASSFRPSAWNQGPGFYASVQRLSQNSGIFDKPRFTVPPPPWDSSKPAQIESTTDRSNRPLTLHYMNWKQRTWRGDCLPRGDVRKVNIFLGAKHESTVQILTLPDEFLSPEERTERETDRDRQEDPSVALISFGLLRGQVKARGPRVHLASSSWAFEEAALAMLQQRPLTDSRTEKVCQLLVFSINHDVYFRSQPSYRLYDLLAGVSIRFKQLPCFLELLRIIDETDRKGLFITRVEKWNDPDSSWRRRWRNRKRPIKWVGNSGGVVF
jgi:hypothetical protein